MWTLARVAEVIERVAGVRYGTTQTWVILRERLGVERAAPGLRHRFSWTRMSMSGCSATGRTARRPRWCSR